MFQSLVKRSCGDFKQAKAPPIARYDRRERQLLFGSDFSLNFQFRQNPHPNPKCEKRDAESMLQR